MTSTNNYGLERCLLVPRDTVGFKEVEGIVEKIDSNAKIKPVVLTDEPCPDFLGFKSGRRSGLLSLDEVVYKIKGCNIKLAVETKGVYRKTNGWDKEPYCGQILADTKMEIEFTLYTNELLAREGFPVFYEPSAIIHYGKFFKIDPTNFRSYPLNLLKELFTSKEELAASAMRIKGDTRLPEIYRLEVQDEKAALGIAYKMGLMAGAQKRITENKIFWSLRNSHVGNYVVFEEEGRIYLGMADFDDATKYSPVKNRMVTLSILTRGATLKEQEVDSILNSLNSPSSTMVEGVSAVNARKYAPQYFDADGNNARIYAPQYFKNGFTVGFQKGYKNPDKRGSITHADLHAVFKFG